MSKDLYAERGVSSGKQEVHLAVRGLDPGLYPRAFCRIYPDYLCGTQDWVNIMHADGAGTKSILAYLYWKETGDLEVWKGIAQDAIVMNLDDLLCIGAVDAFLYTSSLGRNKHLIPGEVLNTLIQGSLEFMDRMKDLGIGIRFLGGETADMGDSVRTILVDGSMTCRLPRTRLITNEGIRPGDLLVGFSSSGQASYETQYNSGIGCNGLTAARHELLGKTYEARYPESWDPTLRDDLRYRGSWLLDDTPEDSPLNIGKLLLSPTRTYGPLVKAILEQHFGSVHGMVHCSGGGQTKVLHYIPPGIRIVKDQLFDIPPVFRHIRNASRTEWSEMYSVFNMGHRLELFTPEGDADKLIAMAAGFGIEARVIGHAEAGTEPRLSISGPEGIVTY